MPSRAACPNLPVPAQFKRPIRRSAPSTSHLGATRACVTGMTYVTLQRFPFEPFNHDKKEDSPKKKNNLLPVPLGIVDEKVCG